MISSQSQFYHYQVGEHSMWAKYTAFEIAHRAPMIIHVPGRVDQVNYISMNPDR